MAAARVSKPQPVCAGKLKFIFPNVEDSLIKFYGDIFLTLNVTPILICIFSEKQV